MGITKKIVASIALVSACGFALVNSYPRAIAADGAIAADADKAYPVIYAVGDLPIWTRDGKNFNPILLMKYIRASVDSTTWGKRSAMQPYPGNGSLVISTTSANHDAIGDLLERLRTASSGDDE